MDFERLKPLVGADGFSNSLRAYLLEEIGSLPLELFCQKGGWPTEPELGAIAILEDSPQQLRALLSVSFTESGAACCSGDNFHFERVGELELLIDKSTWRGRFQTEQTATDCASGQSCG